MVCPHQKKKKRKGEEEDKEEDFRELYDECCREVEKLEPKVVFWILYLVKLQAVSPASWSSY